MHSTNSFQESSFMLTRDGCEERRRRLWRHVPESYSWVLIGDPRHVQYFCNFRVNPISFSAEQRPLLLLTRDGQSALMADNFTTRTTKETVFADHEIVVPWYTHRKSVTNRDHALVVALNDIRALWDGEPGLTDTDSSSTTSRDRPRCGLVESEGVSQLVAAAVADYSEPVFEDHAARARTLGDVIRYLRRTKLPDEADILRRCMRACEAGHAAAFDCVGAGVSEFEVYLHVQRAAEAAAGVPCVVYGDFRANNSAEPKAGGLPTDYQMQPGDLFILDYSVVIHGYRSDFTNTLAVGDPSDDQVRLFEACHDALQASEAVLGNGVSCRKVYDTASEVLEDRGFGKLAHHAGHGLGLEHPEPPTLVPESTDRLMTGDVVTLEPGSYQSGIGGVRLEHNYLISDAGAERLSQHDLRLTAGG